MHSEFERCGFVLKIFVHSASDFIDRHVTVWRWPNLFRSISGIGLPRTKITAVTPRESISVKRVKKLFEVILATFALDLFVDILEAICFCECTVISRIKRQQGVTLFGGCIHMESTHR